jgi:hypothetical protein
MHGLKRRPLSPGVGGEERSVSEPPNDRSPRGYGSRGSPNASGGMTIAQWDAVARASAIEDR